LNCESGDPAYRRLKDQLTASTGLSFEGERDQSLAESIRGRISALGLRDCAEYAGLLTDSGGSDAEMDVLIEQVTIGETYFFRDPEQFAAIRDIIIPDILDRNRFSRSLRIWSAGCSNGAEAYSMAILLMREMAGRLAGWQIAIDATDLNRSSLARAAEGKFRAWSLRATSDAVKRDCFSNHGKIWTIHPRYKQWISFRHANLGGEFTADVQNGNTPFDLILCRNVMIYFAPEAITQLIGRFHQSLGDGGWLVVGASEYSVDNYTAFRTVSAAGARLYQKPAPVLAPVETAPPKPSPTAPDAIDFDAMEDRRMLAEYRLNPAIHFDQAVIFENLGLAGESERSLRRAIYLDRNFALAHYRLGLLLEKGGQDSSAARSFGNVLMALAGAVDDAILPAGDGLTVNGLKELATMHLENKGRT
jgi:chemotaxis protein methyltransferase CheR